MTDTPTPSSEIKARATRLLARFPSELCKAVYVSDKIGYVALPGDLPKKRKELEDSNPLLRPRTKPLHLGAVTLGRPNAKHKAALEGSDLEFVVVVKECVWSLMTEEGRDGALFDVLLSVEVTEKADGSLKYGLFKAGQAYHEATIAKFGAFYDDIVDPRDEPEVLTTEELAAQRMAARPDALVVTSGEDD